MEREQNVIEEWSSNTDKPFCFVVAGETGAGKSTLVNNIAGAENMAEARSGACPVTNMVQIHDREIIVPQPGGINLKLKVQAVDSPGLNDKDKSHEQIFDEISEKVPHPHAYFYCIKIIDRFRESDRQWLSAMSRWYGEDIWKRVVIVLTFANVVQSPMKDMKSHEEAIMKFLADELKLDEKVVSKIPFCLAALEPSFFPRDYPVGEGQSPKYNWKIHLLYAAVSVAPPEITPVVIRLHEQTVLEWIKENGLAVAGVTSALSLLVLMGSRPAAAAAVAGSVVPKVVPVVVPLAVTATRATVSSVVQVGAGVVGLGSGAYLVNACCDKFVEYMQRRQT